MGYTNLRLSSKGCSLLIFLHFLHMLGTQEVLSSEHVCSEDANLAEEAAENTGFKGEVE